jgi:hypothetical protein
MPLRNPSLTSGVAQSNTRKFAMSDEVKKVTVQIKAPRGTFPGLVEEGWYVVFENNVILTNHDGKPIAGVPKRHIGPDGDARLIACLMVRNNRKGRASVSGFNRPLSYQKIRF